MDKLVRRLDLVEGESRECRRKLTNSQYQVGWLEARAGGLETRVAELEREARERHRLNPRVVIDLTQGGDGDGNGLLFHF